MHDSRDIFGAEIQYWRLDPGYWERVVGLLASTGLRCVTTYVPWETHCVAPADKRHPGGRFDFEGRSDPRLNLMRYLEIVEKHGLSLNFRAGPFECNEMYFGGCPGWVVTGDANMMVWDHLNRTTKGYGGRSSQPSYLHPDYLRMVRGYFDAVDPIIMAHSKKNGGCVTMINLDNEVSYIVQDSFLNSDYNPVNLRAGGFYHQFLLEKYAKAANLPYARRYSSIEDVAPPREVPASLDGDAARYLDWVEFKEWAMCKFLATLRAMHVENGVSGIDFMTNLNPHLPEGVPTRMPSFEKAVDGLVGYDFYRGTFMSYSGYHSMARVLKLMNSSLNYTWSAEFMSGTWEKVLSTRVSDDHMRFMARCALAQGCKAISWFMFHDRDHWGDCPCSNHGQPRPSLDVLSETVDICFNRIKGWDNLKPMNDTVVIYDISQHRHTAIGDSMPCADNTNYTGKPAIGGVDAGLASLEYQGLFRLVELNGMQAASCDIAHDASILREYSLAFMPGGGMADAQGSRRLASYVRSGGTLVVSGPWPARDPRGRIFKFLGMKTPANKSGSVQKLPLGKGCVIWNPAWICQEAPEVEKLSSIEWVGKMLAAYAPPAHVLIRPAKPFVWMKGYDITVEKRNFGTAVLQRGTSESVLFVLNHYPEAVEFEVIFGRDKVRRLVNISTNETIEVKSGRARVDVDRKAADIFRVET